LFGPYYLTGRGVTQVSVSPGGELLMQLFTLATQ